MGTWEQVRWEPDPNALGPRRARRGGAFQAFVPELLQSRRWQLEGPVLADLSDAEREVAAVDRAVDTTPPGMPHRLEVLARLQLRAEALGSSQIEGLVVSPRKLALAALASPGGESGVGEGGRAPLGNAAEVLGNLRALEEALRLADRPGPITVADLCALHATLFGGGALARIGGQVRTEQNWIGGLSPLDASFVPPPPGRVPELLHDLCAFLSDDALPPLVQAAVAHAQFETIHPFADGNGRTGRALIHVVLRRRGLCRRFVPPISLVLATRGEAYVQGLMGTRQAMAPGHPEETEGWTSWIELFASATRVAVAQARRYDAAMEALVDRWRAQVRGLPECPRADAAVWPLLNWLPASPLISARDAVALTGRSPRAIDAALAVLAQAGVLRQVGGRQRGRIWEAEGVFDQITLAERALASPSLDTQVEPPARPVPARPAPPRASRAKAYHLLPKTEGQEIVDETPIFGEGGPPERTT